jgi:choline monooxygenase
MVLEQSTFEHYLTINNHNPLTKTMSEELIAADIRVAQTLPSKFYHDESIFKSLLSVFNGWQYAIHKSDLSQNSINPIEHIEAITGEPTIIVKGSDVNAMSNICTHRGMRLVAQPCTKSVLQCEYHGRTFDLDGAMKHMPEFEQAIGFPSEADNLHKFALDTWKGLLFVSQGGEEAQPWQELNNRFDFLDIESFTHDPSRDRDHLIAANWMLYVDNYLEGFHIPFVHPELNQTLDYSGYSTEVFEGGVLQIGKASQGDVKFDLPENHPDFGQDIAAYYLWLFPNMMFNFYPWGLSVNIVIPVSPSETRVIYRGYVMDETLAKQGAGSILDTVEIQDQEIIEQVNKSMRSKIYDRGRYSPTREQGVHHFHRIISARYDEILHSKNLKGGGR